MLARLALALGLALTSSCAPRTGSSVPAASRFTGATLFAALERSGCYGWCPAYRVLVFADGTLEYEGEHFVLHKGLHRGQVTPAQLAALREAFERAGYVALADRYVDFDYTDFPMVTTALRLPDRIKVVHHDLGDTSAPAELLLLEEEIDAILEMERWIGTPEQREQLRSSW
ncbi:MAG: DUF6438 domain-containing protein [Nannocystaceae bacterium]|nr:hypothetical protein [Myxococcales bacterium]